MFSYLFLFSLVHFYFFYVLIVSLYLFLYNITPGQLLNIYFNKICFILHLFTDTAEDEGEEKDEEEKNNFDNNEDEDNNGENNTKNPIHSENENDNFNGNENENNGYSGSVEEYENIKIVLSDLTNFSVKDLREKIIFYAGPKSTNKANNFIEKSEIRKYLKEILLLKLNVEDLRVLLNNELINQDITENKSASGVSFSDVIDDCDKKTIIAILLQSNKI